MTLFVDRTRAMMEGQKFLHGVAVSEFSMPNLSVSDINSLLDTLGRFNMLGALRGIPRIQQVREFQQRAERQLLVAMREATSGRGFDDIISSEYHDLPEEARIAYVIACLVSSTGAPGALARHLRACLNGEHVDRAFTLNETLSGTLVPANAGGTILKPRHRVIAEIVLGKLAPLPTMRAALVLYLQVNASEVTMDQIVGRGPVYVAYRGLVNSVALTRILKSNEDVLEVYSELMNFYAHDFLFLTQHAIAQIQAGNFDAAENYLNQSLNIKSDNKHARHQLGILHLTLACREDDPRIGVDEVAKTLTPTERILTM